MKFTTYATAASGFLSIVAGNPIQKNPGHRGAPLVTIRNGTIRGTHSAEWDQDYFLGIPYAQAPVGNLRLNLPKPLSASTVWSGEFNATSYGDHCFGVGNKFTLPESEDCLSVNIVRPSGYDGHKLPVLVWIYGGGFSNGASSNPAYNFTYQVDRSVQLGKPIIGVTFNYRVSGFGFLGGTAINNAGVANLGLRDQRLLLHWIQENIGAFGGDPKKVVLGGESAGAFSIGIHMLAYGGRDDKLFRGGLMDSGSALVSSRYYNTPELDQSYEALVSSVGCSGNPDTLSCLRQIPYPIISYVIGELQKIGSIWGAVVDGDLIDELGSIQLKRGRFVRVPMIVGSATDEGTMFIYDQTNGVYGVETDEQLYQALKIYGGPTVTDEMVAEILNLYPLERYPERYGFPYLSQYQRLNAIATDGYYVSGQRLTARALAERGVASYSYRWDTLTPGHPWQLGVQHASDFDYWFGDVEKIRQTVEAADLQPAIRKEQYVREATLMSRMVLSFVNDLTPNNHGIPGIQTWPRYEKENPKNMVLDGNRTVVAYVEPDTFRKRQINMWIHRAQEFYH